MSGTQQRKKVVWDEHNLNANEEYRRLHPVTMRIDEPKTPYVEMTEEEKRLFDEEEERERLAELQASRKVMEGAQEAKGGPDEEDSWDPDVNSVARQAKLALPHHGMPVPTAAHPPALPVEPARPVGKKMRPQLQIAPADHPSSLKPVVAAGSTSVALSALDHAEAHHHLSEAEFKAMRKKVYADEGAKFLLLQKTSASKQDEEDD